MKISIKEMTLISLFAALTVIGSYIFIPLPFSPVPLTLQFFFSLLAGGLLGKKSGFYSQLLYLSLGAVGLPVFAGGMGGIGVFFSPTGGYLIGFLPAAYIAGMGEKIFKFKIFYLLLALVSLYLCGIIGLLIFADLNLKSAFTGGVLPFFPTDILKVLLAAYLINKFPLKTPIH